MKTYALMVDGERRYAVAENFSEARHAMSAWLAAKGSYRQMLMLNTELPSPLDAVGEALKKEGKL